MARRRRRHLGLSPEGHRQKAQDWLKSAEQIVKTAERTRERNPCRAIGHYTDAIAEGSVAEIQALQANDTATYNRASKLRDKAWTRQKSAVTACKRAARPRKK